MGFQRGPISYTGSIGNLRNYKLKNIERVITSTKGGPTAAQIASLPSMDLTRKNNQEMKGVALSTKTLLAAMYSGYRKFYDSNVTGRIVAVTKKLQNTDAEGTRGTRGIYGTAGAPLYFYDLILNAEKPMSKVFSAVVSGSHAAGNLIWTMTLSPYTSFRYINFRGKETYYRFRQMVWTLPNVTWNASDSKYVLDTGIISPIHVEATTVWYSNIEENPVLTPLVITLPEYSMGSAEAVMFQAAICEMAVYDNGNYTVTDHYGVQLLDVVNLE